MFEGKSFVENVREVSKPSLSGLKKLQKKILKDFLNKKDITFSSVHDGREILIATMRRRRILVVLDDVHCIEQLEALAGESNWFKLGSIIIITTRNEQVLLAHRVNLIHDVNLLSSIKKEPEWINAIKRLKTIPLKATMERLELSYNGLEEDYNEMFLDVACLLKGWWKENAIKVLKSRRFHAKNGLRVLKQKSLITISESYYGEKLGMHDHLEEMGTRATKCLYFSLPGGNVEIAMKGLANMKYLRFIDLETSAGCNDVKCDDDESDDDECDDNSISRKFDKVSRYLSSSLQFVKWIGFPFSGLPNTIQGKNLVGLEMYDSNIVNFRKIEKERFFISLAKFLMPDESLNLEYLCISDLKLKTVHLGNTSNLEKLILKDSDDLVQLQMPNESLNLEYLSLSHSKLKSVHLRNTLNLEKLFLIGCNDLIELQMPSESLELVVLNLSHSKLTNLHLMNTLTLKVLVLKGCNDLVELHMLDECLNLEYLNLSYSKLKTVHLRNTLNLENLFLIGCNDLIELQMPLESLKLIVLNLSNSKLINLYLRNILDLKALLLEGYNDLVELQMPNERLNLEYLNLSHSKLKIVHLWNTLNLKKLFLTGCNDLIEL
nr:hypothetical protein [Tanacetum cinerariifolium]